MNKLIICLLLLLSLSCTPKADSPVVHISLTGNHKSLQVTGLDAGIVNDIGRNSSLSGWQTLMPVYRMPADTGLKNYQPVQPGQYTVSNNVVIFTPDTPFMVQQTYFLRYYKFDTGTTLIDLIKNRSKPGTLHYTDLIFKR